MMHYIDDIGKKTKTVWDTLSEGALFGAGTTNPWKDVVDSENIKKLTNAASRKFDLTDANNVDELVQSAVSKGQGLGDISEDLLSAGAQKRGLMSRIGQEATHHLLSIPRTFRDAALGSAESRAQLMSDIHEHGILGAQGPIGKKALPGKDFFDTIKRIKDPEDSIALKEIPGVAASLGKGVAKPLLFGGTGVAALNTYDRIANPENHDEGVMEGIGKDIGWTAGALAGYPAGLVGTAGLSKAGQTLGSAAGKTVDGAVEAIMSPFVREKEDALRQEQAFQEAHQSLKPTIRSLAENPNLPTIPPELLAYLERKSVY